MSLKWLFSKDVEGKLVDLIKLQKYSEEFYKNLNNKINVPFGYLKHSKTTTLYPDQFNQYYFDQVQIIKTQNW